MALYSTSDGGQHWTKLSPGANFKRVTSLSFVSTTTGWGIGGQSDTSSFLLKTTDGGKTWTLIPFSISWDLYESCFLRFHESKYLDTV
jgi:photosystem II stability/assembly factor-like uncharacterized protein